MIISEKSNSAVARMEVNVKKKKSKIDVQKIISIAASLAIVAALAAGIISIVRSSSSGEKNKNFIDLNVAQKESTARDDKPAERPTSTEAPTELPTEAPDSMASVTLPQETLEANSPVYGFSEKSSLLWPVEGDVILGYNMDKTIYFPTLDIYRCNPAVIISAGKGEEVLSSAPGVVEEIYEDSEIGTAVRVSIGNGYEIIYGQLTDLKVEVSDHVEAGTVIGCVDEPTKYYSKEGSNIYLKLTRENEVVDPMLYLIEK